MMRSASAVMAENGAVLGSQHHTQPPPRYTEATLVKRMEELGIGRPSTYASIVTTIQDREYVRKDKGRLFPRIRGGWSSPSSKTIFAAMSAMISPPNLEEQLDDITSGDREWTDVLGPLLARFFRRDCRDLGTADHRSA